MTWGIVLGILGAALATVLAGSGSAVGLGKAGQVGQGLISHEPEKFGRVLLLQALPGTQGIYGFLTAILILQKIGVLGGEIKSINLESGLAILLAGLIMGAVGYISAVAQGNVAADGINVVAKKPEEIGKAIILSAMVETYAVIGLLVTILIVSLIKI